MRILILGLTWSLAGVTAFGAGPTRVEALFEENCAVCHGRGLEGGGLGASLTDGIWRHGERDEDLARTISQGLPDLGMEAWGDVLSAEQIRSLVILIREREKAAAGKVAVPSVWDGGVVATRHHSYRVERVVDGLVLPWGVAFLPDGRMLVTEKRGTLRVVDADGRMVPEPVAGTPPVIEHGQGGLMDVAVHPDFATNGWIYLALADGWREPGLGKRGVRALTAIARGRLRDGRWVDPEWVWQADRRFYTAAGPHFGSRIVFDGQGHVFFVVGERGGWHEAQDLTRPNGKIFRLMEDGAVPPDNPFVGREGALPGIWSYGHRNPQGMVVHRPSGVLYATEHGPRGGDELNAIRPGCNYGWPVITHGMNYDGTPITGKTEQEGMEQPVLYWTPSIAACGLASYEGGRFPRWQGDLFAGALAQQEVRRLRLKDGRVEEQEVIFKGAGRVRDVKCGPDGLLYLVLNGPDCVLRLVPADAPAAVAP